MLFALRTLKPAAKWQAPGPEVFNIYILAGQSNAGGQQSDIATTGVEVPLTSVEYYFDVDVLYAATRFQSVGYEDLAARPAPDAGGFGPEITFGIEASANAPVAAVVKVTRGGTPLCPDVSGLDWNVASSGEMYQRLIDAVDAAIAIAPAGRAVRIAGFLWCQGESDSDPVAYPTGAATYQANLTALLAAFRSRYAAYGANTMRFVVAPSLLNSTITTRNAEQTLVRTAQARVAEEDVNGRWVSIDDFQLNNYGNTGVAGFGSHYLSKELVALGRRFATAMLDTTNTQQYRYGFRNTTNPPGPAADYTMPTAAAIFGNAPWAAYEYSAGAAVTTIASGTARAGVSSAATIPTPENQARAGFFLGYYAPIGTWTIPSSMILTTPVSGLLLNAANNPLTAGRLKSVSWYQGHGSSLTPGGGADTITHVLLKIGGAWIISATGFTNTPVLSGTDFTTQAVRRSLTFSRTAANWRTFDFAPSSAFSTNPASGTTLTEDIPESATISDIAFGFFNSNRAVVARLDHIQIDAAPVSTTRFYDLFVIAGQSNAAGYDTNISRLPAPYTGLATPNTNVDFIYWYNKANSGTTYETSSFGPLAARSGISGEPDGEFGMELSLGKALVDAAVDNPVIVKVTCGSSGLYQMTNGQRDWNVATTGALSLYEELVAKVQEAINLVPPGYTPRIRAFIWCQGERESSSTSPEWTLAKCNAYQTNFQALVTAFKTAFAAYGGSTARIIPVQTLQRGGVLPTMTPYNQTVIDAQKAVALADPNGYIIAIDDFRQNDGSDTAPLVDSDNIHYQTGEQVQLGFRVAEAALAVTPERIYRGGFIDPQLPQVNALLGAEVGPTPRTVNWVANLSSTGAAITGTASPSFAIVATTKSRENRRGYFSAWGGINIGHNPDTNRYAILLRAAMSEALPVLPGPVKFSQIKRVVFDTGPWSLNTSARLAVKVNGVWYIGATNLDATAAVTTGSAFETTATTITVNLTVTAANWRVLPFTPGVAFTEDPSTLLAPGSDITATDEITDIGLYTFSKVTPVSTSLTDATGPVATRYQHLAITYTPT